MHGEDKTDVILADEAREITSLCVLCRVVFRCVIVYFILPACLCFSSFFIILIWCTFCGYLRRLLASGEGIVVLGVCVSVQPQLHAAMLH